MIKFITRHYKEITGGLFLLSLFLVTRLVNLTLIPIFTDEAIYLRWSQIMAFDPSLRFLPLVDGKPPLFMWLVMILIKIFPLSDPLLLGRLVSAASGLFGVIGISLASYLLFRNKKITLLAGLLWIVTPFTLFYDRFGLVDGLLATLAIWSLVLSAWMSKRLQLSAALLLGMIIGLGLLTKSYALFFLLYLPLNLLVFDFKAKNWLTNFAKWLGLFFIVFILSQAVYSVLRLFPLFNMIGQKNQEFSLSLSQLLKSPFIYFVGNAQSLLKWEVAYLTIPLVLILFLALFWGLFERSRAKFLLFLYFGFFFVAMAAVNKIIYPRFLLIFTPMLLILIACGLVDFEEKILNRFTKKKLFLVVFLFLVFYLPLQIDFNLLTNPTAAAIPDGDSRQYLNSWAAGYGVTEIHEFLKAESNKYPRILVGTEGTFGLMPYSLQIYQKDYPNVVIKEYWPLPNTIPEEIVAEASKNPAYFIVYQRQEVPPAWKVKLVASFRQGIGSDHLRLYQVLSK